MDFSKIVLPVTVLKIMLWVKVGPEKMVYVIKYSPTLLRHTEIQINKQDVIKAKEKWNNINCGYLFGFIIFLKII